MTTQPRNRTHWREGYRAYTNGALLRQNPFDSDRSPVEYALWHEGWRIAEEDDLQIPSMIEVDDDD